MFLMDKSIVYAIVTPFESKTRKPKSQRMNAAQYKYSGGFCPGPIESNIVSYSLKYLNSLVTLIQVTAHSVTSNGRQLGTASSQQCIVSGRQQPSFPEFPKQTEKWRGGRWSFGKVILRQGGKRSLA